MFGHPGISAYQFAGIHEEALMKQKLSLQAESAASKYRQQSQSSTSTKRTDLEDRKSVSHVSQETNSQQRRRGTFMNHTPRGFEMRFQTKAESARNSQINQLPLKTPSQGSSGQCNHASSVQTDRNSLLESWTTEENFVMNSDSLAGLDPESMVPNPAPNLIPRPMPASIRSPNPSSLASKVIGRSPLINSEAHGSWAGNSAGSIEQPQQNDKSRRRQTPYIQLPSEPTHSPRFSPLEPWVDYHRRQRTGGAVNDLPPQVHINDIAEVATFRAVQEYFDSQVASLSAESNDHRRCHSPSPYDQSRLLESQSLGSTVKQTSTSMSGETTLVEERIPAVSACNPRRNHLRSISGLSLSSDFASAAEGQYSPYEKEPEVLHAPNRRGQIRIGQPSTAGSSTLGRMAPPILGHAALTATADLNDLSFYLKNTGPSPDPTLRPSKRPGFNMFKLRNRKTLAQRVGSVEGSPLKARAKPPPPACAHETTTSSGIKHLRIVIPTESLCNDLPITFPVSGSGSKRRSRHVSIAWTEEMLNPLASLELENAISGFNSTDAMSPITPTTPVRSPKRSPVSAERITLEGHDHPLASREEQTKARKLRDLRKNKAKKEGNETEEENAHEGAQSESDMSPASAPDSTPASSGSEADEGNTASKMDYLEAIVQSLQGQNTRLTQALAKVVGLDSDHGTLDPEAVLKAFERAESRVRQAMNNAADNI